VIAGYPFNHFLRAIICIRPDHIHSGPLHERSPIGNGVTALAALFLDRHLLLEPLDAREINE
jgi:hypothetical protein